jgi:hypothetical protein
MQDSKQQDKQKGQNRIGRIASRQDRQDILQDGKDRKDDDKKEINFSFIV